MRFVRWLVPFAVAATILGAWELAAVSDRRQVFPQPGKAFAALGSLARSGSLWKHVAASLFRVTWGFFAAAALGVPLGLLLGRSAIARRAINPWVQILRPISPLAWSPLAILAFGISDHAPIFLIFLASVFPIAVSTAAAARGVPEVYVWAGRGFGLRGPGLLLRVILPAATPQILTGIRVSLGIAWLVVVAAEMIAATSGLGYLVLDARNAGNRYDLVVASMIVMGLIGLALDRTLRQLERFSEVRWAYGED